MAGVADEVLRLAHGVRVVRDPRMAEGGTGLIYSPGVSHETTGARRLAMSLLRVPPGGSARPHYHLADETLIYVLQGRAETRFGDRLSRSVAHSAGDTLFIAARVPHAPRNLSDNEPALAINARTDPSREEPIVAVDPAQASPVEFDPRGVRTLADGDGGPRHLALWRLVLGPRSMHPPEQYAAAEIAAYAGTGGIALRFGDNPLQIVPIMAGDFVFVPDGVRHQWHNTLSGEAWLVIARSTREAASS